MYLFDLIFNSLPDNMKNDVVLGTIKETLLQYLKTYKVDFNSILTSLKVCGSTLSMIDFTYLETIMPKVTITKTGDEKDICNAFLYCKEYIFRVRIRGSEKAYEVFLEITENNKKDPKTPIKKIEYKYEMHDDFGVIEERKSSVKGNYYYSYSYDAKAFRNGIEVAVASEKQKDREFADKFSVPYKLARKYRENFEKYAEEINKCANLSLTQYIDDIKELNWSMQRYDSYEEFINYLKSQAYNEKKYEEISNLFNQFKSLFTKPFAISANTLDAISFYLIDMYNALGTRGVIVIKNKNSYELYYIAINDNNLVISPTSVSNEKAKEMFDNSKYDVYADGDIDDLMSI